MKTVIMAGGRGTRISELFPEIPKYYGSIEDIPALERESISLRDQRFADVIMTVSHQESKIMNDLKVKRIGQKNKLSGEITK